MSNETSERNALAELAVELERFVAENKGLFASRPHLILRKAQRIVAELAKAHLVEYGKNVGDVMNCSYNIGLIRNCRAIAEEGMTE